MTMFVQEALLLLVIGYWFLCDFIVLSLETSSIEANFSMPSTPPQLVESQDDMTENHWMVTH